MKRVILWLHTNFWVLCFGLMMIGGIYAAYVRALHGADSSMDISSVFPWNLVVGLNVFCGIALAAGGCTVAATIHILNGESYRPVVRPSLVVGFLGYLIAFLGFISDQNLAIRIASQMGLWSERSIRYGVTGALILFGAVVVLDFAPELSKYLRWRHLPNAIRILNLTALFLALIFSVLCQSTLIDVLQAAPRKVSPLWSSSQLPFLFFISSACGALAAVIFASWHTSIAFGRGLPTNLVASMGKALAALLFFYLCLRFADFLYRRIPVLVQKNDLVSVLFSLEIGLFFLPMWLLIIERDPVNSKTVYYSAVMVLAGLITNRLNTCVTSTEAATGLRYLPNWTEFMLAYSIIAVAIAVIGVSVRRLPVFAET